MCMTLHRKQDRCCHKDIHDNQLGEPLQEQLVLVAGTRVVQYQEIMSWQASTKLVIASAYGTCQSFTMIARVLSVKVVYFLMCYVVLIILT